MPRISAVALGYMPIAFSAKRRKKKVMDGESTHATRGARLGKFSTDHCPAAPAMAPSQPLRSLLVVDANEFDLAAEGSQYKQPECIFYRAMMIDETQNHN